MNLEKIINYGFPCIINLKNRKDISYPVKVVSAENGFEIWVSLDVKLNNDRSRSWLCIRTKLKSLTNIKLIVEDSIKLHYAFPYTYEVEELF